MKRKKNRNARKGKINSIIARRKHNIKEKKFLKELKENKERVLQEKKFDFIAVKIYK